MVVVLGGVKPRAHAAGVVDQKVVHEELPSDGDVNYCRGSGEICWVRHDAAVVLARRELRRRANPVVRQRPAAFARGSRGDGEGCAHGEQLDETQHIRS